LGSKLTTFTPSGLLFPPLPNPKHNFLEIVNPKLTSGGSLQAETLGQGNKTFANYRQDIEHKDSALPELLQGFGRILPEYDRKYLRALKSFHYPGNTII
jgi:hypothetical protein